MPVLRNQKREEMSCRHIAHDTIGQVLSRLAAGVIMLDAYAEANKGDDCAGDMKYGSKSLRECMYLLTGKNDSERFLAALRAKLEAETSGGHTTSRKICGRP